MLNETKIEQFARPTIPNIAFYLPFGYLFCVRLGTLGKLLSWLFIYILPTFWFALFTNENVVDWTFYVSYALLLLAIVSLYECGYIANDTDVIKHEKIPTVRLYEHNFQFYNQHKISIYAIRAAIATLCLCALYFLTKNWILLTLVITIPLTFSAYNAWRSKWNVLLYPFLVFSRYLPFLFLGNCSLETAILLFAVFPLPNFIERFSMPKYRFQIFSRIMPNEQSKTWFRVIYYTIALGTLTILNAENYILILFLAFLAYRLGVAILVQFFRPKNYLQNQN